MNKKNIYGLVCVAGLIGWALQVLISFSINQVLINAILLWVIIYSFDRSRYYDEEYAENKTKRGGN